MINTDLPTKQVTLKPEDFDPPLQRKEPKVPGYWILEELAKEIGASDRKIRYDITGYPEHNIEPNLKAYKAGRLFLVPDDAALEYIQRYRERKKS
jgi:hypothetical protein